MRRTIVPGLLLLCVSWATVAGAVLAPAKPSQMVLITAATQTVACPPEPGGTEDLTEQIFPDGTRGPFSIPPGQVLVVTEVEWSAGAATPGVYVGVGLFLSSAPNSPLWSDAALADSTGFAAKSSPVPNAVIKSGGTLCRRSRPGLSLGIMVRGFFTRDK
jgi:hypothetical protein